MLRKNIPGFKNITLARKLTVLLLLIFLGGITFSGIALANILNYKAQHEIRSNTLLLFQTLNSVRSYTNTEITPQLQAYLGNDNFIPQVVPSYSSRKVFERLRNQDITYKDFLYKDAMLNPTNPQNQADSFERSLVEKFNQNKNLKELSGFRDLTNENYFYIARPLIINDASCLRCHSTPDIAPKEMTQVYGNKNGFGWKLNQAIGVQIVCIPTNEILQKVYHSFGFVMAIVTLVFAIAIFTANYWLRRYVIRPIHRVVRVAEAVSTGNMDADFGKVSNDEVGSLVEAFTRMKLSLLMAIRRLEQYRIDSNEPRDRFGDGGSGR